MSNIEYMSVVDLLGFINMYKTLSYKFYSYLCKKSSGKNARRLLTKIASDENQFRLYYKKIYSEYDSFYDENEINVIEELYLSILDKPIIPMQKNEWKLISKSLISYKDAYNIYDLYSNDIKHFLMKIYNNLINEKTKLLLRKIINKEETYKDTLNKIYNQLTNNTMENVL